MENDKDPKEDLEALKAERDSLKIANDAAEKKIEGLTKEVDKLKQILTAENPPDVAALQADKQELTKSLEDAAEMLRILSAQKKTEMIDAILERSNIPRTELDEMDLKQLQLVLKSVDSVKGAVKSVKAASEKQGEGQATTIPPLYGVAQGTEALSKAGVN